MAPALDRVRHKRAHERLFYQSFTRMKKRGLSDQAAGEIAKEVAEESLRREKPPVFRTDQEYAEALGKVCQKLSQGMSHYELIGDMPYVATGRVERLVAVAMRTKPPVDREIAVAASRAVRMERLSAGLALLFTGLALGTLGLWYAIAVGVAIAVAAEIYVQTLMPMSLRRSAAKLQAPLAVNFAAAAVLVYFGYSWSEDTDPRALLVLAAAVSLFVVSFVAPGLTLALLVSRRDHRRVREVEQRLLEERAEQERESGE